MFKEFQKIPRFYRDIIVTEKIDGTNAQVTIVDSRLEPDPAIAAAPVALISDLAFAVYAGSRNRFLSVKDDNFGFARWVQENAAGLSLLGPGEHFGEWWGSGIQRGYGLEKGQKRFSLFNVGRWTTDMNAPDEYELVPPVPGLGVVPVLFQGAQINASGQDMVREALRKLEFSGSAAAPGFKKPEGVVVYHTHARQYVGKVTLGNDGHKGA
jgi:RNA ligase.